MSRIEELEKRLAADPTSRVFVQLAEEYRKQGLLEEAIDVCRRGLENHPQYPSARVALGRALLEAGSYDDASEEFEAVLAQVPDNILANKFLGETYEQMGRVEDALAKYQVAYTLSPEDSELDRHIQELQAAPPTPAAPPPPEPSPVVEAPVAEPQGVPPVSPEMDATVIGVAPNDYHMPPPAPMPVTPSPSAPVAPPAVVPSPPQPVPGFIEPTAMESTFVDAPLVPEPPAAPPPPPVPTIPVQPASVEPMQSFESPVAPVPSPMPATPVDPEPVMVIPQAPAPEPTSGFPQPAGAEAPPQSGSGELETATMAELYANQGHFAEAVAVYRRIMEREPRQEYLDRIEELELMTHAQHTGPESHREVVGTASETERLEAIERLEQWLAAIRKSRGA